MSPANLLPLSLVSSVSPVSHISRVSPVSSIYPVSPVPQRILQLLNVVSKGTKEKLIELESESDQMRGKIDKSERGAYRV